MYPFLEPAGMPNTLSFCSMLPRANRNSDDGSSHFSSCPICEAYYYFPSFSGSR